MPAEHETMTAEESDADISASRERNIETARSLNFEAYLAVKARAEAQAATIASQQAALVVAREALSALSNQVQAHVCAIDNMDADEFCEEQLVDAEAALTAIDAALKGAHPAQGGENVG